MVVRFVSIRADHRQGGPLVKKRDTLDPMVNQRAWCLAIQGMFEAQFSELELQLAAIRAKHPETHEHYEEDEDLHARERRLKSQQDKIGEIIELIPAAMVELSENSTTLYRDMLEKVIRLLHSMADELHRESDAGKRHMSQAIRAIAAQAGASLDSLRSTS